MKRAPHLVSTLLVALGVLASAAGTVRADRLVPGEEERLARGGTVVRPVTIDDGEHRLVGGITYTVLDASLPELTPMFDDEAAYRELLPRTKDARVHRDGRVRHVAMRTGNALVDGVYTLYLVEMAPNEFRFWLDPRAPHDIDDAYGYFRFDELEPSKTGAPRTLLTYAIAIDVGPGIVRDLFEERVRSASLSLPQSLVARLSREHRGRPSQPSRAVNEQLGMNRSASRAVRSAPPVVDVRGLGSP